MDNNQHSFAVRISIGKINKMLELVKKGNMQKMHIPNSGKPVASYNLDVIISVAQLMTTVEAILSNLLQRLFRSLMDHRQLDHP